MNSRRPEQPARHTCQSRQSGRGSPALALLACLGLLLAHAAARAETTFAEIFSDNMVVQRDMPLPVWGTSEANREVTVYFAGQVRITNSDENGRWMVRFEPVPKGGPHDLTASGITTAKARNIMAGDVWLCVGQGNLSSMMREGFDNSAAEIRNATKPTIRLSMRLTDWEWKDLRKTVPGMTKQFKDKMWLECTPSSAEDFSALAYCFATEIQPLAQAPIGIICRPSAFSPASQWVNPLVLESSPLTKPSMRNNRAYFQQLARWLQERRDGPPPEEGKAEPQQPARPEGVDAMPPGSVYNQLIAPLIPFPIKGVIWDHGEAGAGLSNVAYDDMMRLLIDSWRTEWGYDIPFVFAMQPRGGGYGSGAEKFRMLDNPQAAGADCFQREVYTRMLQIPNTGMVNTQDVDPDKFYSQKRSCARRYAAVAMGVAYNNSQPHTGPIMERIESREGKMVIHFKPESLYGGLVLKGEAVKKVVEPGDDDDPKPAKPVAADDPPAVEEVPLLGFSVASTQRRFVWANAKIVGNTVEVWSDKVATPVSIRYGWEGWRWGNLSNKAGLPALPFRSDNWNFIAQ